ncbi:MAG: bleomycin resistance protein [Pseudomonadota bacterium]
MPDTATPNLPSRDFDATERFYSQFSFERVYRDHGWMILRRGTIQLEFFLYPDLVAEQSAFGSCIRLDDLPAIMAQIEASDVPDRRTGMPRFHPPRKEPSGLTIAYMIDPDGSLIRLIQND